MIKFLRFSALQYFGIAISIVVNFFLAKMLTKGDYGLFSLGTVIYNIIFGLSNFGLDRNGLVRLNQSLNSNELFQEILTQFTLRFIVTLAISIVMLIHYFNDSNFLVLSLYVASGLIHSLIPKYLFDFENKFITESWISILDRSIYLMLLIVAVMLGDLSNLWLGLFYFIGRAAYSIAAFYCLKLSKVQVGLDDIKQRVILLFKENFLFWLATVSNIFLLYFNQLILTSKVGVESLAIFAFAMQFISLLRILQSQFLRWVTPELSVKISENSLNFEVVRRNLINSLFFSLIVSALLFFSAFFVIQKFYPSFSESINVLLVLCIWSVFYGPGIIISFVLSNRLAGLVFLIISLITSLLSVILGYLFQSDPVNLAVAIAASHSLCILFQFYLLKSHYDKDKR